MNCDRYLNDQPCQQMRLDLNDRGFEILHQAEEWIGEHPDFWERIITELEFEYSRGAEYVSMRDLVRYYCRYFRIGCPNALTPAFVRISCREHPEFERMFRKGKSVLDGCV